MRTKQLTASHLLVLHDMSTFFSMCMVVVFVFISNRIPFWASLLLFGLLLGVDRICKRHFAALARLARRTARSLPLSQRRVRYHWLCGQVCATALIVAWIIPFGFTTGAFWCIYIVALIVIAALLEPIREDLFRGA